MWPIGTEYLRSIYRLPHQEAACLHDETSCEFLLKTLLEYCRGGALKDNGSISQRFSDDEKSVLKLALAFLERRVAVRWFPDYGCALLISNDAAHDLQTAALNMLGLDSHEFDMVSHTRSDQYQHTADAADYQALHVGTASLADVDVFRRRFDAMFQKATERTGEERSARGGKQGHQRTPAFVHAVLRQAFYCECIGTCNCEEEPSLGGFTDVGLHTGGAARNTGWPLVCALFRHALDQVTARGIVSDYDDGCDGELVFRKALLAFDLVVVKKVLRVAKKADRTVYEQRTLLDSTQAILSHAAIEASKLADNGHDMTGFSDLLVRRKEEIITVANDAAVRFGEQFRLPSLENFHQNFPCRNFAIQIPPEFECGLKLDHTELGLLKGTEKNIRWVPAPPEDVTFPSLSAWLNHPYFFGDDMTLSSALLALRTVENKMWSTAKKIFNSKMDKILGDIDADVLVAVVDRYRTIMHELSKMPERESLMKVEQQSAEMLVVWVTYCLIYGKVDEMHQDIMATFGVALDINGLRHLVLSDKEAIDAVLAIAGYLQKRKTSRPLFSLKDESHTRALGRLYARKHLSSIWKQEQCNAESRTAQHWGEVRRKQQRARTLREELKVLRSEYSRVSNDINIASSELCHYDNLERKLRDRYYYAREELMRKYDEEAHFDCNRRVEQLRHQSQDLRRKIKSKADSLSEAEMSPEPVQQPLPKDEALANSVLFFLHMPNEFSLLARMTFTAQQMLVPFPWVTECGGEDGIEKVNVYDRLKCEGKKHQQSWTTWYNDHQQHSFYTTPKVLSGSDSYVYLRVEKSMSAPKGYNPTHVDKLTTSDHGVWHPDGMIPRLAWCGGPLPFDQISSREFDPFAVDDQWTVSYFTERLSGKAASLQWAFRQPGITKVSPTRGNRPLASQNEKPDWLSKQAYLTFGKIRGHPYSQLRNVLTALAERSLPLSEPAVQVLLRQSLYHIGNICCVNDRTVLEWKRDLYDGDLSEAASSILSGLSDEIQESPKQYKTARLVGGLANFFGQWNPSCRKIARQVAASLRGFARDINDQIAMSAEPKQIPMLRSKQVIYYYISVLCLSGGDLSTSDVKQIVELVVNASNLFYDDSNAREVTSLIIACTDALFAKSDIIRATLLDHPCILDDALKAAVECSPSLVTPWRAWETSERERTFCFEAQGKDGCFYSINAMTGTVLVDAKPPSRLPIEITSHPLYKRTFADRNFEVVRKQEVFETVCPIRGRFYRFALSGKRLAVLEVESNNSDVLELLDHTSIADWGMDLPVRLRELHSHWLSRKKKCVLLRGVSFNERATRFALLLLKGQNTGRVETDCKIIPQHLQDEKWQSLTDQFSSMDCMVQHQSPVLDIISKLEDPSLIHVKKSSGKKETTYELPRFGLSFRISGGSTFDCLELAGYTLAQNQQLSNILRGFSRYLVLQGAAGPDDKVILVPCGNVIERRPFEAEILTDDSIKTDIHWYQHKIHPRFKYPVASTITSRLQLASLHIVTSSTIPDPMLGMSGEERAASLLRECWTTIPFNSLQQCKLNDLKRIAHGMCPAISLLCKDIETCSQRVSFLMQGADEEQHHVSTECDEGSAYLRSVQDGLCSFRMKLTRNEERRTIGMYARRHKGVCRVTTHGQELPPCPVTTNELESVETEIFSWVADYSPTDDNQKEMFPLLTGSSQSSKLGRDIVDELEDSWDLYKNLPEKELSCKCNRARVISLSEDVKRLREDTEKYLMSALNELSSESSHWHNMGNHLRRLANIVPTANASDIARLAISSDRNAIENFNPTLSTNSKRKFQKTAIFWLKLCVLEDKMQRLLQKKDILRELQTHRTWDAHEHPYWLVFEVEGGLQIRPEQYAVAKHLIENPGDIVQLNMGAGKTRVILPMLVLYWSFKNDGAVTRLNFLSPLLTEAYSFLHHNLCASVLGIKLFTMDFCRDVVLSKARIETIKTIIKECCRERGAFVVAPEHRLSLENKQKEYENAKSSLSSSLKDIIHGTEWRDVLDEVDELLHHRFQLIYAVGDVSGLPGLHHRSRAVQALLHILAFDDHLARWLKEHSRAVSVVCTRGSEAFPAVHLLAGRELDSLMPDFRSQLATALLKNLPRSLVWLKAIKNGDPLRDDIFAALTDPNCYPAKIDSLPEEHKNDVLALRGFIAGDILSHCLGMRHRVDFGVARPGKKKLAVPFRAADTPSERAEFAHPDCALGLTILAYYSDGLSVEQLKEAFAKLLEMGDNAQQSFYRDMFELSKNHMREEGSECLHTLDSVEKIDLSNESQIESLWHYFRYNTRAINFWLDFCVFPSETAQYPQRITSTSWNLADSPHGRLVGFSGTNDTHRILPLQVRQYFPSDNDSDGDEDRILKELASTNGKMIDVILKNTQSFICLQGDKMSLYESLLHSISRQKTDGTFEVQAHALIDSGAFCAGHDNFGVAKEILGRLPGEFQGVTFFDKGAHKEWVILERSGRCLPKDQSPVRESDAFAFFDEPRCRGSDLKLSQCATALLSLGPNMCKDKFMQAAGRMRELGRGQRLKIIGTHDVYTRISQCSPSTPTQDTQALDVLRWVMQNTIESNAQGLPAWSDQAYFYAATSCRSELTVQDEMLELAQFYGRDFGKQTVLSSACKSKKYHLDRLGKEEMPEEMMKIIQGVSQRIELYGEDFCTAQRGADEECECELELEQEEEEETEEEVPQMKPVSEAGWDVSCIFFQPSPAAGLPTTVYSLVRAVEKFLKNDSLLRLNWSKLVYCTENFIRSIAISAENGNGSFGSFLRLVDAAVIFPSEEILLVSESEADLILKEIWQCDLNLNQAAGWRFVHHSFLRATADSGVCSAQNKRSLLELPLHKKNAVTESSRKGIDERALVSMQLFAGETMYKTGSRCRYLKETLQPKEYRGFKSIFRGDPRLLVELRGLLHLFPCSDLERICSILSVEASLSAPQFSLGFTVNGALDQPQNQDSWSLGKASLRPRDGFASTPVLPLSNVAARALSSSSMQSFCGKDPFSASTPKFPDFTFHGKPAASFTLGGDGARPAANPSEPGKQVSQTFKFHGSVGVGAEVPPAAEEGIESKTFSFGTRDGVVLTPAFPPKSNAAQASPASSAQFTFGKDPSASIPTLSGFTFGGKTVRSAAHSAKPIYRSGSSTNRAKAKNKPASKKEPLTFKFDFSPGVGAGSSQTKPRKVATPVFSPPAKLSLAVNKSLVFTPQLSHQNSSSKPLGATGSPGTLAFPYQATPKTDGANNPVINV